MNIFRRGSPKPKEEFIVSAHAPNVATMSSQLTEKSTDFAERGRYHQSEIVKGENFDNYQ